MKQFKVTMVIELPGKIGNFDVVDFNISEIFEQLEQWETMGKVS